MHLSNHNIMIHRKNKKLNNIKSFFSFSGIELLWGCGKPLSGNKLLRSLDKGDLLLEP